MKAIQNTKEFDTLLQNDKMVVVDFYADWCGPCQTMLPIMESLSNDNTDVVEVVKVNVDQNPELASRYGVRSIPTFIFIQNENVVERLVGIIPKSQLQQKIQMVNHQYN